MRINPAAPKKLGGAAAKIDGIDNVPGGPSARLFEMARQRLQIPVCHGLFPATAQGLSRSRSTGICCGRRGCEYKCPIPAGAGPFFHMAF